MSSYSEGDTVAVERLDGEWSYGILTDIGDDGRWLVEFNQGQIWVPEERVHEDERVPEYPASDYDAPPDLLPSNVWTEIDRRCAVINQELIDLAHLSDPAVGVGKVQRELFDVQVRLKAATAGQPTKERTG